jgi:hypothetical protein
MLPQTLLAKTAGPLDLPTRFADLWRQVKIVGATDGLMATLLALALVAGGRRVWPRGEQAQRAQRLLPWVWVVAVPALYVVRGVTVLSRYLLPLLPVLSWLAWRAGERWSLGSTEPRAPRAIRRTVAAGAVLALLVVAQNLLVYRGAVLPQVRSFSDGLRGSLVPMGRWLRVNSPPLAAVATPDIGAIGYFGHRRVVDLAGLVTPEMVPYLEREPYEEATANFRFASFARPEYVLDRSSARDDLRQRSRYARALTPVGYASVPNLGVAHPDPAYYTLYRVDWAVADSLGVPQLGKGRNP